VHDHPHFAHLRTFAAKTLESERSRKTNP